MRVALRASQNWVITGVAETAQRPEISRLDHSNNAAFTGCACLRLESVAQIQCTLLCVGHASNESGTPLTELQGHGQYNT